MTASEGPSPIPDSYRRVTPCLTVRGAGKALEFYAAVFGATERMRSPGPGGTILHAEIEIGDSVVMVEDDNPQRGTTAPPPGGLAGFPAYLFIYVEDVDAVIARAAELGATVQRPAQTQFYGEPDEAAAADRRALELTANPAERSCGSASPRLRSGCRGPARSVR